MNNNTVYGVIDTPIGLLDITANATKLLKISFLHNADEKKKLPLLKQSKTTQPASKIMQQIVTQLTNYFKNPNYKFTIKLQLQGTDFQKKVWQNLRQIPVGETITYGELAKKLNTSARAIGNACRNNPIPIIIPCHRVISKNNLGGFGGKTYGQLMQLKKWLLTHEAN